MIIHGDSQLVVRQVNKDCQSPLMEAYIKEVRKLEECFDRMQKEHVPCAENNLLTICQIALRKKPLWNQGLLCSI